MSAYFNAATDVGEPPIAQDLGVTQWIDPTGLPMEAFDLAQMGAGYKLLFCFQHTCSDCHRIGFPALVKLFTGLRGHPNVRFAAIQTVVENFEFNTYAGILNDQLAYTLPIPFGHDDGQGNGSVVMQRYGGKGTPWFILIDPAGRVIHNHFHIDVYKTISLIERAPHAPPLPANNWGDVVRWANHGNPPPPRRVEKTDAQWRALLTPDQFYVTREKGTEPAHSSAYCTLFEPGFYHCVCCNTPLFNNDSKFRSRSGWPSFTQPLAEGLVAYHLDEGLGMRRIETTCQICDAHLGHVFPDGPEPTGLRYCINALALRRENDNRAVSVMPPHPTMQNTNPAAPAWIRVTGEALLAAIRDRRITYDSGATQHFLADGTTPYVDASGPTKGGWRVDAERFYSVWPPSTHWDGYDVEVSADGTLIRFVTAGAVFAGRYTDH